MRSQTGIGYISILYICHILHISHTILYYSQQRSLLSLMISAGILSCNIIYSYCRLKQRLLIKQAAELTSSPSPVSNSRPVRK